MLFIIPPNAATHIIITITQPPAEAKPPIIILRYSFVVPTVPANFPNKNAKKIPENKQINVWYPINARIKTITNGTAIYKGTPFLTCSSKVTAAAFFSAKRVIVSCGILLIAAEASPTVEGKSIAYPITANKIIPVTNTNPDQTPWCLILLITSTLCIPELTIVVSDIRPMLSPKHAPPAIAAVVKAIFPPTIWLSHKNIGAQAANVPHDVPVAIDRIAVIAAPTTATVFPVIPTFKAIIIRAAPTPVDMNASAIA